MEGDKVNLDKFLEKNGILEGKNIRYVKIDNDIKVGEITKNQASFLEVLYKSYCSENKDLKLEGKADAELAKSLFQKLKGKRGLQENEIEAIIQKYFAEPADWKKFLK